MNLSRLPRWLILLLVALAARALTFGNPVLHVDEAIYFEIAQAMWGGALPYVDVWDRKPIGLFLLYALPARLGVGAGIWAYQLLALAFVLFTALGIARLATRAGWGKGATLAAIAYILWLNLLEGQGGQSPVFYNLFVIGAVLLAAPRRDDADRPVRRFARGLGAMALVGLAIQIKYSVVFEGAFLGLWLMWREWRCGRNIRAIAAMGLAWAAIAIAPTAAAWASYAAIGQGDAFIFANFTSIFARRSDPLLELLGNLGIILLLTSPLVAMGVLGWRLPSQPGEDTALRRFLFAWLIASASGVLLFGSWFDHYALPLIAPLAVCAARFIGGHRHGRRFALIFIILVAVGGQILIADKRQGRGTPAQFAALTSAIGSGPGCLYNYSGPPLLYAATQRCRATRYIFPSHLGRLREGGAIGVDQAQEIRRIFAQAKPAVVVMRRPYRGEDAAKRALVTSLLEQDYAAPHHATLGDNDIAVFHRR